ncbi:hypothetical protein GCM10009530_39910 [Microbispora corallina]|uniref:hypothetical protein n=1 Tax=Microbispora corallina TaxID=83302 RepID=UPI001951B946|nr:hypothetical protein [Microbispora corallina]
MTFDTSGPDYLAGDHLYQVLVKIRDSPISVELLGNVTNQAPDDWKALVAEPTKPKKQVKKKTRTPASRGKTPTRKQKKQAAS